MLYYNKFSISNYERSLLQTYRDFLDVLTIVTGKFDQSLTMNMV